MTSLQVVMMEAASQQAVQMLLPVTTIRFSCVSTPICVCMAAAVAPTLPLATMTVWRFATTTVVFFLLLFMTAMETAILTMTTMAYATSSKSWVALTLSPAISTSRPPKQVCVNILPHM
jgi:hypothetical protein